MHCQRGRTRVTAAHTDPTSSGAAPSVQVSRRVRIGQSLRQLAPTFVARQARSDGKREGEMWRTDDCSHQPWCLGVTPALRHKGSLTEPVCGGDWLCVHGLAAGTQTRGSTQRERVRSLHPDLCAMREREVARVAACRLTVSTMRCEHSRKCEDKERVYGALERG